MDTSLEQDIKSGFNKAGIFPLNRNRVLDMLPPEIEDENDNEKNDLSDSLTTFLKEMRYGKEDIMAEKSRKKS